MYKIIGADKVEYGPASAGEVGQWLREGRADGNTLAQLDGGTWQPLYAFPEFSEFLAPAATQTAIKTQSLAEMANGDFHLDILDCFKRAAQLLKRHFVPLVMVTAPLFIVDRILAGCIGWFAHEPEQQFWALFLDGIKKANQGLPVTAEQFDISNSARALIILAWLLAQPVHALYLGIIYSYYLKLIRGETATLGDAFRGMMNSFSSLVSVGFFAALLFATGMIFCFIVPGVYLWVGLMFAIPLVCDRHLSFGKAMLLSLKIAGKHWFILLALMLLVRLAMVSGVLLFGVGFLATLPLGYATYLYAYESIFNRKTN